MNIVAGLHTRNLHFFDVIHPVPNSLLVEPDEEDGLGFDLKEYCRCHRKVGQNYGDNCHIDLNTILKIPLRNADQVVINDDRGDFKIRSKRKPTCIKLRPKDHKYNIVNSCHGLLCLSELLRNDPLAVSNPVTGEFVNLPPTFNDPHDRDIINCGLGFSPKTNQYKVIRVLPRGVQFVSLEDLACFNGAFPTNCGTIAEVHTLGTDSWRRVVNAPYSRYKLAFPTYLNGALYCFCINDRESDCIISFNFDEEQFKPVPLPLPYLVAYTKNHLSSWKSLTLNGLNSWYEVIAYTPSFISLKDILVGYGAKVHNVNSRCEKIKLPGETKAFALERTDMVCLDDEACKDEVYFWAKHFWSDATRTRCARTKFMPN
ncbi:hypothetical protein TIFTF001_046208 [Ficus carica]|uniref:F-box associated beta-propeller type 1 domain-containing protein n=1 Tax=Ficus carica TaxID=3494 RepID=A0AA88CS81_FICCA|nr:hypothetical protein TIFTF001_046208 [Ficus carica]